MGSFSEVLSVSFLKRVAGSKKEANRPKFRERQACSVFIISSSRRWSQIRKQGAGIQSVTEFRSGYRKDPRVSLLRKNTRIAFDAMALSAESRCTQCRGPVPKGRTRYCSDECLAQHKREEERLRYGHRHEYRCAKCGHQLRVGRHRKGTT
jgi:hypothetical protein